MPSTPLNPTARTRIDVAALRRLAASGKYPTYAALAAAAGCSPTTAAKYAALRAQPQPSTPVAAPAPIAKAVRPQPWSYYGSPDAARDPWRTRCYLDADTGTLLECGRCFELCLVDPGAEVCPSCGTPNIRPVAIDVSVETFETSCRHCGDTDGTRRHEDGDYYCGQHYNRVRCRSCGDIVTAYSELSPSEPWCVECSRSQVDWLYGASELLVHRELVRAAHEDDGTRDVETLREAVTDDLTRAICEEHEDSTLVPQLMDELLPVFTGTVDELRDLVRAALS